MRKKSAGSGEAPSAPPPGTTVDQSNLIETFVAAFTEAIGEDRFGMWFRDRTQFTFEAPNIVVGLATLHLSEWLSNKYGPTLIDVAKRLHGKEAGVVFRIDPAMFQEKRAAEQAAAEQKEVAELPPGQAKPEFKTKPAELFDAVESPAQSALAPPAPRRRVWHHLSDFVVGSSNRVAHAAAVSIVEEDDASSNPLVFYGPVGTGKTHLLEGIAFGIRKQRPELKAVFVTAEDFTNRFVSAMHQQKFAAFRKQFRDCDVLLLDDLQFLATKRRTQEEFVHTFDALVADGRQIVLTVDCHPRLCDDLMPELIDRLLGGAVWGLQPPDSTTRRAILKAKSTRAGLHLDDEVLDFLAGQLRGNVRELEGAVRSLRHYSKVTGRPADVGLAREALGELLRHAVRVVTLKQVDQAVCTAMRLEPGSLQGKARSWAVSHPRMVAVYIARKHTASSYSEIGKHFGGRNHTTAVAGEKKVRQWLATDGKMTACGATRQVSEWVELVERALGM